MTQFLTLDAICPAPSLALHVQHVAMREGPFDMHAHDFGELVVVSDGNGDHVLPEGRYALRMGDIFYIEPGRVHGYEAGSGLIIYNVIFEPGRYLSLNPELQRLPGYHALFHLEPLLRIEHKFESRMRMGLSQLRRVRAILDDMVQELAGRRPGFETVVRAGLSLLLATAVRDYQPGASKASRDVERLSRAVSFIETHYGEDVTLESLAAIACMSRSTLMRAFGRCYGASPMDYLIRFRVNRACEMLSTTDAPITDIAYRAGFHDGNYFSRQFRRVMGMPPREYRRRIG